MVKYWKISEKASNFEVLARNHKNRFGKAENHLANFKNLAEILLTRRLDPDKYCDYTNFNISFENSILLVNLYSLL